ncbi:type II toxin-antitoxin system death-on-curing family toxin [Polynucleobacter sp. JS-Safj-400b-B2]|uniref:type II toxin-antitoxin system death-on-curing family toxin n=1 Tax=Polynucleobacter sp. JS-Safj-400b-B2 TaxID=2576921 RepID=UPI001C0C488C|nr:type II toxin-antitoxin system death-on-curing family toxin [Polynucleobacter sp. JS-Safj-400b-B2]MBU3625865.1 type II toxin-antitoxin system death-on-curing family toxin [Polynucleobacter sp. JS-Safj-400b-B2]
MQFFTLNESDVIEMHDAIIGSHELQGLAADKSLAGVLARLQNRLDYGFITDVFQYAACAGVFIAKGHCFNDANKRTAAAAVHLILCVHELSPQFENTDLGKWIVQTVEGSLSDEALADLLRQSCS